MGIVAKNVGKHLGDPPARILTGIDLEIKAGEFVALTGRSGSGKSTLLYILSSLDDASEGSVEIDGHNLGKLAPSALHRLRNQEIGFVFQFHFLIAELTALENVLLPARKAGCEAVRKDRAKLLLKQFGLGAKMHRLPRQLSGGEQQRMAIARSLIMEPKYLFADEPTGSLDSVNGQAVMNIFQESNKNSGTTIVMVTHDVGFAQFAKRQIHLADGRIVNAGEAKKEKEAE